MSSSQILDNADIVGLMKIGKKYISYEKFIDTIENNEK